MASIVNWAIVSKLMLLKKSVKNPIFPLYIKKIDTGVMYSHTKLMLWGGQHETVSHKSVGIHEL